MRDCVSVDPKYPIHSFPPSHNNTHTHIPRHTPINAGMNMLIPAHSSKHPKTFTQTCPKADTLNPTCSLSYSSRHPQTLSPTSSDTYRPLGDVIGPDVCPAGSWFLASSERGSEGTVGTHCTSHLLPTPQRGPLQSCPPGVLLTYSPRGPPRTPVRGLVHGGPSVLLPLDKSGQSLLQGQEDWSKLHRSLTGVGEPKSFFPIR